MEPTKKGKVLIVEDNNDVSRGLKIFLEHYNFKIIDIARNAEDAFKIIEQKKPDIILMDIELPGLIDGIDATKYINEKWDIPVIYLTAHTDNDTLQKAKNSDAYSYLIKDNIIKEQLPILIEFAIYRNKMEKEKKKNEEALKQSEEKFRSIASSAKDAIVLMDNIGKITFWNHSAERIFGYSVNEVIGKMLYELIAPKNYKEFYKKGFSNFKNDHNNNLLERTIELDVANKDGNIFPVEISMSAIFLNGEWCGSAIIRDIRLRKVTEEEMEKLIEELNVSKELSEQRTSELLELNKKLAQSEVNLKELNASKEKFFSIIAHDLKGPFHGLLGYSEILSKEFESLSKEEMKLYIDDLYHSSLHLFKLLENLLQWSRLQRGILQHIPTDINLRQLADMNINILSINAYQKNIILENNIEENLVVCADMNMINTVLRNLLSNAIKFTKPNGKIKFQSSILENGMAQCQVIDSGIGIKKENINKLFRIDEQFTTEGTMNEKGTGLGLILCRELIEKNGGTIYAESQYGKGSKFIFTLPISESKDGN